METGIWPDVIKILTALVTGAGFWAWIKAREDKKKTPYDMFMELLSEQKKFFEQINAAYEQEKLDSAEKSAVIMQSNFCKHKYLNPDIVCPVDVANDKRLHTRCDRLGICPLEKREQK